MSDGIDPGQLASVGHTTQELLDTEAQKAAEIERLVAGRTPDELAGPDLNDDGWSVKDLVVHIAYWQHAGADAIEAARGEYEGSDEDTDRSNAELLERSSRMSWDEALEYWAEARARSRVAVSALPALTPSAATWFTEEGIDHMDEHLVPLRDWAGRR